MENIEEIRHLNGKCTPCHFHDFRLEEEERQKEEAWSKQTLDNSKAAKMLEHQQVV